MNLREQFEKETGKCAKMNGMLLTYFNSAYVQWLEQRFKEQVEVLNKVRQVWPRLAIEHGDEGYVTHKEFVDLGVEIEEQLKKSK